MTHVARHKVETIAELLEAGAGRIGEASDTPALDARILLQALLKKDQAWLIAHGTDAVDPADARRFHDWIRRRAKSEPVAYITGRKSFWTLELNVTPKVLVPRPETELLVERALEKIPLSEPLKVLDLGTGSGAIAITIAVERPLSKVVATDRDPDALRIAEQNKGRAGIRNVDLRQGDWYEAVHGQRFSVIVCNPPYVPRSHYEAALTYEPRDALFAGENGLDALGIVIRDAMDHIEPGGWLLVEHGYDQEAAIKDAFRSAGFDAIETLKDYAGHPRVTEGRRPRR